MRKVVSSMLLILFLGCEKPYVINIPYTTFGKKVFDSDDITGGNYPDRMEFGIGTDSLYNTAFLTICLK